MMVMMVNGRKDDGKDDDGEDGDDLIAFLGSLG